MGELRRSRVGYLERNEIQDKIDAKQLDAYDIIYTTDTYETYIISPDYSLIPIQSRNKVFKNVVDAEIAINSNTDTYGGQIVSIINSNGEYDPYIVNETNGSFYLQKITGGTSQPEESKILYLTGTSTNPVIVNTLNSGIYSISGDYKISSGYIVKSFPDFDNIVLVEKDGSTRTFIRVISANGETEYTVDSGVVSVNNVLTEDYVDNLEYVKKTEINNYIANMMNEKIGDIADNAISSRLSNTPNELIRQMFEGGA